MRTDAATSTPAESTFSRLGRTVARHRRRVLVGYVIGVLLAGTLGVQVFAALKSQGFADGGSEAARADAAVASQFGVRAPSAVLVVSGSQPAAAPATSAAAERLVAALRATAGVGQVTSWWTSGRPATLLSRDGRSAQVLVVAATGTSVDTLGSRIATRFAGSRDGLTVLAGGAGVVGTAINHRITNDLSRAESIAVPVTLLLLLFVFGSLVSAGLPFIVALGAIVGSFLLVWMVTLTTDVSIFAVNLITGLGLGLGIDYALLVVNRFREELHRDGDVETAVARTVASAGRTVAVSAATVCIVLASLLLFPQYFLKSFGYAGIAVTALAGVSAVTALPAVLATLGPRVDRGKVRRGELRPRETGLWSYTAALVMRRPWPVLTGVLVLLAVLASPVLSLRLGQVDDRALPASDPAAAASAAVRTQFTGLSGAPVQVVLPAAPGSDVREYALALSRLPHVRQVTGADVSAAAGRLTGPGAGAAGYSTATAQRLEIVADVAPASDDGRALVTALRAVPSPDGQRLVGGAAADFTDAQHALRSRGIGALIWIIGATLVMLFLFTGSVVLAVKAVLLNLLSLGATVGMLAWVFGSGHLRWLVGRFTVTGAVDTSTIVLVAVVAFALSTDYELFLLSRIKEEHDAGQGTVAAVTNGLQRSGRIITAAAVLIAIVFATFVTSGVTNIKELGVGVAFAILLDATIVRGLLVPAFMRLAGRWNWWAPRPLRRLHTRIGLAEI